MFTILWYAILTLRLKTINFFSFSSLFSLFIFLIISGRIPFPLSGTLIESWMVFGLVFVLLNLLFVGSGIDYLKSCINGKINLTIFTFVFLLVSIVFSCFSLLKFNTYNDGYFLLFLVIFSISYILTLFGQSNKREQIRKTIFSSIVSSTLIVSLIAYLAQLLITIGIYNCDMLKIYHPENDIHCIPFFGTQLYRFSIGSNINEFSFYLVISLIIVSNNPKIINSILPFKNIKFFQKISFNFVRVFFLLAIIFCLSRAAFIGVIIFYIVKICQYIFNSFYFSKIKINKKDLNLIIFISALTIFLFIRSGDLYTSALSLLKSRFGFITNPFLLLEGTSSQQRLWVLSTYYQDQFFNFSFFPSVPIGRATNLHNSFVQFFLEYGLLPAIIGLILLLKEVIKKTSYVLPVFVFLVSHHILYNPILWIYLASVSMIDKYDYKLSLKNKIINYEDQK